jgi:hypothetical protein
MTFNNDISPLQDKVSAALTSAFVAAVESTVKVVKFTERRVKEVE